MNSLNSFSFSSIRISHTGDAVRWTNTFSSIPWVKQYFLSEKTEQDEDEAIDKMEKQKYLQTNDDVNKKQFT